MEKINIHRRLREETKRADENYAAYDRMRQKYRHVVLKYREIRGCLKEVRELINDPLPDFKLHDNGSIETVWPVRRQNG